MTTTAPIQGPGSTPAYLDVVSGVVAKKQGVFTFSTRVAAPVPAHPVLPSGVAEISWWSHLDTDPTTFPNGFPRGPGEGLSFPPEFAIWVGWSGTRFEAFVADRRPSLVGGDAIMTSDPRLGAYGVKVIW